MHAQKAKARQLIAASKPGQRQIVKVRHGFSEYWGWQEALESLCNDWSVKNHTDQGALFETRTYTGYKPDGYEWQIDLQGYDGPIKKGREA